MVRSLIFSLSFFLFCSVVAQGSWSAVAPYPGFMRWDAVSFSIYGKGYVATGNSYGTLKNDMWAYDTLSDAWTQKANFPGTARDSATCFVIDSFAVVGLGHDANGYCTDFWFYMSGANVWNPIGTPFPGTPRSKAVGLGVLNSGYIMFGYYSGSAPADFWKYNFGSGTWSPIAGYPGPNVAFSTGFTINQKIYTYTSFGNPNFYEYNPSSDTWTPKAYANFTLIHAVGFAIGTKGYIATGADGNGNRRDVYSYNSVSDNWTMVASYATTGYETSHAIGFALGSKGYVGLGDSLNGYFPAQNFWKFSPCTDPVPSILPSGSITICDGDSVQLASTASTNNQWFLNSGIINGATGQTYYASQSGQYTVSSGCSPQSPPFTLNLVTNSMAPPICMVTVDSLSQYNVIMWDKTPYNNVDSFIVYRETSTNNYQRIGGVHYDSLSLFVDTAATIYFPNTGNPNNGTYRYKLQVQDTCGNYGPLGDYHNTIYILHNLGTFAWTQLYTIENGPNPVSTYVLMRDDNSTGNWQPINSVAGTQQTIVDPAYNAWQATASWRVQTFWSITCTPTLRLNGNEVTAFSTSKSNTITPSLSVSDDAVLAKVSVFPVPASNSIYISQEGVRVLSAEIFDAPGNLVLRGKGHQVDITTLEDGMYFIRILTDRGIVVKRFIKM